LNDIEKPQYTAPSEQYIHIHNHKILHLQNNIYIYRLLLLTWYRRFSK